MKLKTMLSFALLCAMIGAVQAQCSFNPTVTGDSILCPGGTTTFITQEYDSYQWFRRLYADGAPELIAGATQQSIALDDGDLLYYYWVEATDEGCTEASPQVLLDGYVFLLPFVSHSGDFVFDPELQAFKLCAGDTMFLTFSYGTNVTWYKDSQPIPGETGTVLAVTETGAYTVQGAPNICPNFITPLGLVLEVVVVNCTSPVEEPVASQIAVYPNPASDWLTVENSATVPLQRLELVSAAGQLVRQFPASGDAVQQLSLEGMPGGIYFLRIHRAGDVVVAKLVKE